MTKNSASQQKRKAAEKLEALLLEGLSSGPAMPLTKDELNEMRRVVRQKVLANKKNPESSKPL